MKTIDVATHTDKSKVTREDGRKLLDLVRNNWNSEIFVFDFRDVTVASVSFFDEVFGLLSGER